MTNSYTGATMSNPYIYEQDNLMRAYMQQVIGIPKKYYANQEANLPITNKKPEERRVELCLCTKHLWN